MGEHGIDQHVYGARHVIAVALEGHDDDHLLAAQEPMHERDAAFPIRIGEFLCLAYLHGGAHRVVRRLSQPRVQRACFGDRLSDPCGLFVAGDDTEIRALDGERYAIHGGCDWMRLIYQETPTSAEFAILAICNSGRNDGLYYA